MRHRECDEKEETAPDLKEFIVAEVCGRQLRGQKNRNKNSFSVVCCCIFQKIFPFHCQALSISSYFIKLLMMLGVFPVLDY